MIEQQQILENYLKERFKDKQDLSVIRLDKIADGWESDNHAVVVDYGDENRTREDWLWRIYSGEGSPIKAAREFDAMRKLFAAGYPVPRAFLLEVENSPTGRPFILTEFIEGKMLWHLLDGASGEEEARLIDRFCRMFIRLHELDWKRFDDSLPEGEPLFFIDRWLNDAQTALQNFPDLDAAPFVAWVNERRDLFACARPSPVHNDFHPGNILIKADGSAMVIDWTGFSVTDPRLDLAWTLTLARAHGKPHWRDQILKSYQCHAGKNAENIEAFEVLACARRLFDVTVSLTHGAQALGMNEKAIESIRTYMDAHKRVYRFFVERSGLQIKAFGDLFG